MQCGVDGGKVARAGTQKREAVDPTIHQLNPAGDDIPLQHLFPLRTMAGQNNAPIEALK